MAELTLNVLIMML